MGAPRRLQFLTCSELQGQIGALEPTPYLLLIALAHHNHFARVLAFAIDMCTPDGMADGAAGQGLVSNKSMPCKRGLLALVHRGMRRRLRSMGMRSMLILRQSGINDHNNNKCNTV